MWIGLGAIGGFFAVTGGAFGAHVLKSRLAPNMFDAFVTGGNYLMYHSLALLAVGILEKQSPSPSRPLALSGAFFTGGSVLFSGSLWLMAATGIRKLGAITPIGGVGLLFGWASLAVHAFSLSKAASGAGHKDL